MLDAYKGWPMADTTENEFLRTYDANAFPRPSVAVDVALVTIDDDRLQTLLIRRTEHPQRDSWSLPGGFVRLDESLDATAERVLATKAGVTGVYLEQLYTFGEPARDPRTRVISVAYYALVPPEKLRRVAIGADQCLAAIRVPWAGETGGPVDLLAPNERRLKIAFDHGEIVGMVVKRLRGKLAYAPVGYALLPKRFTLLHLQRVHEIINGSTVNKDSFRRRMLASGELEETGAMQEGVGHRPASLYRVSARKNVPHG
jgi:8-oxo-dGTP diphosphatase